MLIHLYKSFKFKNHIKCIYLGSKLKVYGLTQNTETNEYMMAFQYATDGNLYKFLRKDFQNLIWQTKLKLLFDISKDLYKIHNTGYIHADLHSGNILQNKGISKSMQSYITDLGLSKNINKNDSEDCIYGVIPYVAPEVLSGQKFTKAADIYDFGVIISEMSTGQRPFYGYQFDELAVKICTGLRPGFVPGTPDCYIELANQCMDSDPQKRPKASQVCSKLKEWIDILEGSKNVDDIDEDSDEEDSYEEDSDKENSDEEDSDEEDSDDADKIKKQFLNADKIVKTLPGAIQKHPDHMYTSKIIYTQRISSAVKGTVYIY